MTKNHSYWENDFSRDSVASRLADAHNSYRSELRDFWLKEFPLLAIVILVVVTCIAWCLKHFLSVDAYAEMLVFGVGVMVPPVLLMEPKKPNEESVAYGMLLDEIGAAAKRRLRSGS